jgi:hypothetical protein
MPFPKIHFVLQKSYYFLLIYDFSQKKSIYKQKKIAELTLKAIGKINDLQTAKRHAKIFCDFPVDHFLSVTEFKFKYQLQCMI